METMGQWDMYDIAVEAVKVLARSARSGADALPPDDRYRLGFAAAWEVTKPGNEGLALINYRILSSYSAANRSISTIIFKAFSISVI